jgi:hypothetical protein
MNSILTIFGESGDAELSCRDIISTPISELSSRQLESERQAKLRVVVDWESSADVGGKNPSISTKIMPKEIANLGDLANL